MKTRKILSLAVLGSVFLYGIATSEAQERFQLKFKGSCVGTNESGVFLKSTMTDKSLVNECVTDLAITNKNPLVLTYTVGGDFNGDVIEVVNRDTGLGLCQKMRLLFPQTLSTGDGSEVRQLVYVFRDQQAENVGSGVVTKRTKNNKVMISGRINFYILPEGTNGLQICEATFNSVKALPGLQ